MDYYKPKLEEFHEGFIFEYCPDIFNKDNEGKSVFKKEVYSSVLNEFYIVSLGRIYNIKELCQTDLIRVKYLTYKEIVNEGFEMYLNNVTKYRSKDNFCTQITYFVNDKSLHIKDGLNSVYDGTCKNINEFRNIINSVTIKCFASNEIK